MNVILILKLAIIMAFAGFLPVIGGMWAWKKMDKKQETHKVSFWKKAAGRMMSGLSIIVGGCVILASLSGLAQALSTEPSDLVVTVSSSQYTAIIGQETFFTITVEVQNIGSYNYTGLVLVLKTPAELIWNTWSATDGNITHIEKGPETSDMRPSDVTWTFSVSAGSEQTFTGNVSTRQHISNEHSSAPDYCWTSIGTKELATWEMGDEDGIIVIEVIEEPNNGDDGDDDGDENDDGGDCLPNPITPPGNTTFNKTVTHIPIERIDALDWDEWDEVKIQRSEGFDQGNVHNIITSVTGADVTIRPLYRVVTVSSVRVNMFVDASGFDEAFNSWKLTFVDAQTGYVYGSMIYEPGMTTIVLDIAVEVLGAPRRVVIDASLEFNLKAGCEWTLVEQFLPFIPAVDSTPTNFVNDNLPDGDEIYRKFWDISDISVGAQNSRSTCSESADLGTQILAVARAESCGNVWMNISGAISSVEINQLWFTIPYYKESVHDVTFAVENIHSENSVVENMALYLEDSAGNTATMPIVQNGTVNGSAFTWTYTGSLSATLVFSVFYTGAPGTAGSVNGNIIEIFN